MNTGLLCNCGFSFAAVGTASFEVPLCGAGLAEVFNVALSIQTAWPEKLSEKISAGLGMVFFKFS